MTDARCQIQDTYKNTYMYGPVPYQLGLTSTLHKCTLPYQATFICIEMIKSSANCLMGCSNAGALVTIGLIIDFNFVSSLKEQYVMAFVCCLMSLPFSANLWEYYQVHTD